MIISQDGSILTNNHVVDGAQEVSVTMADKQVYKARVIGRDDKTDLAVLKLPPPGHSLWLRWAAPLTSKSASGWWRSAIRLAWAIQ